MHGATVLAADYVAALRTIGDCRRRYDEALHDADAILTPTVPIFPPRIADSQTTETYLAMNTEVLAADRVRQPARSAERHLAGQSRRSTADRLDADRPARRDAALLDLAVLIEACLADGD